MEYVVKSERLMQYLYNLGLNYRRVTDKKGKRKYIYLFENDKKLNEAISFYYKFKNTYIYNI